MKKIALLMAVLMLVFSLAACGGESAKTPEGNQENNSGSSSESGETTANTVNTDPAIETADACEHQYEQEVLEEASCTKAGVMQYVCSVCTHSYTEQISATGHDGSGASCVEVSTCANCGEVVEAAWGHEAEGDEGLCKHCGIDMTKVPASGNSGNTQATEATEATEAAG